MPDRLSGIILESKSMRAIFQKKGKKMQKMFKKDKKRAKYLEIRAKMFKTWKHFKKGQLIAYDYHTQ